MDGSAPWAWNHPAHAPCLASFVQRNVLCMYIVTVVHSHCCRIVHWMAFIHPFIYLAGESMDRGAWPATVHGVEKSWIRLSCYFFLFVTVIIDDYLFLPLKKKNVLPGEGNGNPLQYS